jgi:hypothetical protein
MRQNIVLGSAIAAALASASAGAATSVDIYVSGSSAAQTFFSKDMQANLCGGAGLATANYLDTSYTAYAPAFAAFQCTNAGTSTTYTLHYAAELGSTWGVYESINPTTTRQYLTPSAAGCPAGTYTVPGKSVTQTGVVWPTPGSTSYCTASGYNHVTDAVTTNTNNILTAFQADIVVSDVESVLFENADNWPSANHDVTLRPTILGPAPTASQLNSATVQMSQANGQVFQIIGHGIPGVADTSTTPFSLSSATLRAIYQGRYHVWKQVPEVGANDTVTTVVTYGSGTATATIAGTAINVCRRDHGSGTELSADMAFAGNTCGIDGGGAIVSGTVTNYVGAVPPWVYEAPATPDMKACVQSAVGTVGFVTNSTKDAAFNYKILYVDGYAPSAHNAAAGWYPYGYEINMATTGSGSGNAGAASTLVLDAKNYTKLNISSFQEAGALASTGGYVATTLGSSVLYAIPVVDSQSPSRTAAQWATDLLAEGLYNRAGDSCALRVNSNK